MTTDSSSYAALILPDASALEVGPYLAAAQEAVAARDTAPGTSVSVLQSLAQVAGDTIRLTITAEEMSDYGPRILITATACPNARFSEERAARILSDTVLAALEFSDADIIEWFAPDTLLVAEEFVELCSYVSPRRSSDEATGDLGFDHGLPALTPAAATEGTSLTTLFREPLPDGIRLERQSHLTERLLARCDALRTGDAGDLRMQAAGWAMTGTVACIAPPVGASMTILGMARGIDFRRVTQALTITALFVLLQNQGLISSFATGLLR